MLVYYIVGVVLAFLAFVLLVKTYYLEQDLDCKLDFMRNEYRTRSRRLLDKITSLESDVYKIKKDEKGSE